MIGQTISQYKILEKLGEGGMGEVFLAEDTKLKRKVALKFLSQEFTKNKDAVERFQREAQAAAALNHPNIVTIYDINEHKDQTYITMEYVEGQTLKEQITNHQLPITKILDITTQICEGLSKAHEAGIVHRDIKPHNILIDKDGRVKILDFGLAKLKGVGQITRETSTIGTVHYMSPEQTLGKEVDHRTDIWSLGVILYEMLTGKLPFKGDYEQAVIYSILNEKPESVTGLNPEVPEDLDQIIFKMLSKKTSERYQNSNDIIVDLEKTIDASRTELSKTKLDYQRRIKSPGRRFVLPLIIVLIVVAAIGGYFLFKGKKTDQKITKSTEEISDSRWKNSIAVLSFVDMSPQKDQEYFCDGMAEEIINALTHIKDLKIVARTSAFAFKGKNMDVRQIGEKLNVNTILEGSIRKSKNRVRITAQLVNVKDGYHIWSEKYERSINDIFDIQDEISLAIVQNLKLKLLGDTKARMVKQYTKNLEAYNLYIKGRYFWNKRTGSDVYKALEFFEKAIKIDPNFALAYTGKADCYSTLGWYDYLSPREVYLQVKSSAEKALEIDNNLAEAHTSFAHAKQEYEWDFAAAEKSYQRAIELNPNYATSHHWYGLFLNQLGRHEEAIAEIKLAQQLDPLSLIIKTGYAGILCHARKFNQAIKMHKHILELNPNFLVSQTFLGYVYMMKEMYEEAITELKRALILSGDKNLIAKSHLGSAYAFAGKNKKSHKILNELLELSRQQYVSPVMIAHIYFSLGENDLGFEWLEKGFKIRDHWMIWLKVEPRNDIIRPDPRFKDLLRRIGFKE